MKNRMSKTLTGTGLALLVGAGTLVAPTGVATAAPTAPASVSYQAVKMVPSANQKRAKIIKNAKRHLGAKYRFGGTSPRSGWDCSGYVQYVFKKSGIKIARTKAWTGTKKVSRGKAKAGDYVVQYGGRHVGIYAGNNKIYHAANPKVGTVRAPIYANSRPVFFKSV